MAVRGSGFWVDPFGFSWSFGCFKFSNPGFCGHGRICEVLSLVEYFVLVIGFHSAQHLRILKRPSLSTSCFRHLIKPNSLYEGTALFADIAWAVVMPSYSHPTYLRLRSTKQPFTCEWWFYAVQTSLSKLCVSSCRLPMVCSGWLINTSSQV